jgi:glycosyltransferase involved in cell wall biosynthesis
VLDSTTGRLAPAADESGFADVILGLLRDPDARHRMGSAGRKHVVGTFSLDRLVDDVDSLYRRLMHEEGDCA